MIKMNSNFLINFKNRLKPNIKKIFRKNSYLLLDNLKGNSDHLIAGPFLGEFGWELMQWQGYLRQLAKFYKRVIVYGRPSSEYLYRDFAFEFRAMHLVSWDTDAYLLNGFDYSKWASQFKGQDILIADNRCKELSSMMHQDFIRFGEKKIGAEYDLIIHARDIPPLQGNKNKALRNWPRKSWDKLCNSLSDLKIASVGIKELSYAPEGTDDLRGIETEELCSILTSSRCCVGPSSGLMHLASLCGTPHIVWTSDKNGSKRFGGVSYRYLRSWNPLGTKIKLINDEGGQPSPEYVKKEVLNFL